MSSITVGNRTIDLGNPDKVMYPEAGLTKSDVADYYRKISEHLLPHTEERPISMRRFPDGIEESGFYQKKVQDYFPDWLDTAQVYVEEDDEEQPQLIVSSEATLVFLTDQACLSIHPWLSRQDKLDYPDKVIFDLDPPDDEFEPIREGALIIRRYLQEIEIDPFVMTTGSRGLHVAFPIERDTPFDEVRDFVKKIAAELAEQYPDKLTNETSKSKRKGRLFLDYLRNSYGQTSVAPYSLRAIEKAPIATPLSWDELDDPDLTSQTYNAGNIFRRLGQKSEPWKDFFKNSVSIKKARENLQSKS